MCGCSGGLEISAVAPAPVDSLERSPPSLSSSGENIEQVVGSVQVKKLPVLKLNQVAAAPTDSSSSAVNDEHSNSSMQLLSIGP
jgi:hypothetical protein